MLLFKNQTGILLTLKYNETILAVFINSILIFLFNNYCLYVSAVILKHIINFVNIRHYTNTDDTSYIITTNVTLFIWNG